MEITGPNGAKRSEPDTDEILIPSPGALGSSQGGGAGDQLFGGAGGGGDGGSGGSSSGSSGGSSGSGSGGSGGATDEEDDSGSVAQAGGQDAAFVIAGGDGGSTGVESGNIVGAAAGAKGGCSLRPGSVPLSTELLSGLFLVAATLILFKARKSPRHRQ